MAKENKDEYYIYNHICEIYEKTLLDNCVRVYKFIGEYINKRIDVLQGRNPGKRLLFTNTTENEFYDCCGVDKSVIAKILNESPNAEYYTNSTGKKVPKNSLIRSSVIYNLLATIMCIYYKHNDELVKHLPKDIKYLPYQTINLFLTMKIYSFQNVRIFKYEPNEEIMEYTIQNLNNRFLISSAPNIFTMLYKWADDNITGNDSEDEKQTKNKNDFKTIDKMSDDKMYLYINNIDNKIKSFLLKIRTEFFKNWESGKKISTQVIQMANAEGDNFYVDVNNIANTIETYSRKVLTKFTMETSVREKLLQLACSKSGAGVAKSRMMIQSIKNSKDEVLLKKMISNIIAYWLVTMKQSPENIHSKKFITSCAGIYTFSHTNDPYIIELKNVLGELIEKYSNEYVNTERKATLSSFKQCLHIYIVLYIANVG